MSFDLILGASILVLTGVVLALRTRCNFLVMALCGGYVLANTLQSSIYDLTDKLNFTIPGISLAQVLQLVITLLPAIVVALRFYKSQRGISLVQQLAPAIGAVGLLVVFIQPILEDSSLTNSLDNSVLWGMFNTYRTWIILFAIGTSLLGVLVEPSGPKRGRPKKKD